ncbi:MAG: carbon-nitrogen hydrolase family protein [Candidatus Bipolaricaulaceae bacterium]
MARCCRRETRWAKLVHVVWLMALVGVATGPIVSRAQEEVTPVPWESIRVAVVQFLPGQDKAANLDRIEQLVEVAAAAGADLVVLPELCTGNPPWRGGAVEVAEYLGVAAESLADGPTVDRLAGLARRHALYICWGMVERGQEPQTFYNAQVLVDFSGALAGVYRKAHLAPGTEQAAFSPGERIQVFSAAWGAVGMMISDDHLFPELARTYALLRAGFIVVSAAADRPISESVLVARAQENGAWLIFASQAGAAQPTSRIIDPWGVVRAEAGDGEEIISLPLPAAAGQGEALLARRLPELYAEVPVIYPADKQGAVRFVAQVVLGGQVEGKRLYVSPGPLPPDTVVQSWTQPVRAVAGREWLVFVDDAPEANWEHPCRYVFVDAASWAWVAVAATTPPRNLAELEPVGTAADD